MEILGIDQNQDRPSPIHSRSWQGVKEFFNQKIASMKVMKEGVDGLENVVQQVEHQLSSVSFFLLMKEYNKI